MTEMNEKAKKFWVLALASIASCMVALDALVVTTALSSIRVGLGASLESLEWTVNAYNLSFAVLLLTGTALGDRFGRRRMFSYGIGLFAGGSAACGLATSVGWLIAARALQGAGAALVVPLAMALLGCSLSSRRARAGTRDLQWCHGRRAHRRTGRRRRYCAGPGVAVDLLDQSADSRNRYSAGGASHRRELRTKCHYRHSGNCAGDRLRARFGMGPNAREQCGLEQPRSCRNARSGPSASRRLRRLGAARARANGPDAVLPLPRLCIGHRVELLLLCLDVWRLVLLAAVSPDRAGLRIICRRLATAALDRHAVRGGAVRWKTGQPDRRTPTCRRRSSSCKRSVWRGLG